MQEILKEIGEIQAEIELLYASMRTLAHKLANDFSHADSEIIIAPTMRQSALEKERAFNEVKERRKSVMDALSEMEAGKEAEGRERAHQKELIKSFEAVRLSLGAVAFEQALWAESNPRIKELLTPFVERFTTLSKQAADNKGLSRFFARYKLGRLKKHQDREFSAITSLLEKEDALALLSGERAFSLVSEHKRLSFAIKEAEKRISVFKRKKEGDEGISDTELSRIDDELKVLEDEYDEAFISYGFYLFENGAKWITENTAEKELDLISEMLECQKQLDYNNKLIQMRKDQIAIDDFNAIIKQNHKTISALRSEIERIEHQIADVEEENSVLFCKIEKLKESSHV